LGAYSKKKIYDQRPVNLVKFPRQATGNPDSGREDGGGGGGCRRTGRVDPK